MGVGIAYVDGPRLARSIYAASDWVAAGRDEINRINVFPVPDGDTGTNFSLTLRAVADALRALGDAPLGATAQAMARAAVMGARGNSGMMLAHFLLGFSEGSNPRVGDRDRVAGDSNWRHATLRRPRRPARGHHPDRRTRVAAGASRRPPIRRTSASSCADAREGELALAAPRSSSVKEMPVSWTPARNFIG
jgi:hypothetical protein